MVEILKNSASIEDAKIIFKNFAGEEGKVNKAGDRNFCIILDPDDSIALERDGYNIKTLKSRNDEDDDVPYLPVAVSYKNVQPNIYLITSSGKTRMTEDTISMLDSADIITADVVVRPYDWEVNGKTGRKAYAKAMYVNIEEDRFASKYNKKDGDVPF